MISRRKVYLQCSIFIRFAKFNKFHLRSGRQFFINRNAGFSMILYRDLYMIGQMWTSTFAYLSEGQ